MSSWVEVEVDPLHDPLEGLSPPLYLATLALVDGMSGAEEQHLRDLAARMAMPAETALAVSAWVSDYDALLERLETLVSE